MKMLIQDMTSLIIAMGPVDFPSYYYTFKNFILLTLS